MLLVMFYYVSICFTRTYNFTSIVFKHTKSWLIIQAQIVVVMFGEFVVVVFLLIKTTFCLSTEDRHVAQSLVKEMFNHAFDNYMSHAFPKDELAPLSCNGTDTLGGYALTLRVYWSWG